MALKDSHLIHLHSAERWVTPSNLAEDRDCQVDGRGSIAAEDHARIRRADPDAFTDSLSCRGLAHSPLSHIVTMKASVEYHNLCDDGEVTSWHIVTMDDQEKNGGPNHLKAWREYRDLTQAELASEVGTNANMISYLESGERGLSAKWLRRLADALKITPGHLLDHDPRDLDNDILEIWMNADATQRRQLAEVAKALVRTGTEG